MAGVRPSGPELLEQQIAGDRLVRVHEQERQQRPLLLARERNRGAVSDQLERAEQAELHPASWLGLRR